MNILPNDVKHFIEEEVRKYNFKELMKQMQLKFHFKKVLDELVVLYNELNYKTKWGINRLGQAEMSYIDYDVLLAIDNRIAMTLFPKFPVKAFQKAYQHSSPTNRWEEYHYTRTVPNVIFHEESKRIDVSYEVWISREEESMDIDIFGSNINHNFVENTEIVTNIQNDKKELETVLDFYETVIGDYWDLNYGKSREKKSCYAITDDSLDWILGEIDEIEEIHHKLMWAHDPKGMKESCCISDSDEDC